MVLAPFAFAQQPPTAPPSQSPPPSVEKTKPPPAPLKRVHVELAGFELDKAATTGADTQIGGGTRDIGGVTTLLAPRFCRVYTESPVFRWSHTTQAREFEFRLFDTRGTVLYSSHASGREFRYPNEAPALEPGVLYAWNVRPETALLGDVSLTSRFVRLSQGEIDELSKELGQSGSGGKSEAERRAEILIDRRLWFDSVEALSDLIRDYPTDPRLFERRATIYDQISATRSLAEEDFAVADKLRAGRPQIGAPQIAAGQAAARVLNLDRAAITGSRWSLIMPRPVRAASPVQGSARGQ